MAPIRVGLIGLGATPGGVGPGTWGILAHLASLLPSPHYELVAVCNSSVESARRSIEYHKLPSTVKAYGSPEDIANDPDVDLVCVSIVVGKHLLATKPALLAKKQVFVEWPLGASTAEAEEMAALAKEANLKTVVGAQLRSDPAIAKIKQLVDSGAIGKVTSSEASLCPILNSRLDEWMAEASFYLDFNSGGNEYRIVFAHFLDSFIHVLGDFATVKSTFAVQHPLIKLIDSKTGEVVGPAYRKTAPDHVFINGVLENGAVASLAFRKTPKAVDNKILRWVISGTEGELEFTVDSHNFQMGSGVRTLRIRTAKDEDEARTVEWEEDEPEHVKDVGYPGLNTARLLEAFASGKDRYPDFEAALKLHKLLDRIAQDAGYQ